MWLAVIALPLILAAVALLMHSRNKDTGPVAGTNPLAAHDANVGDREVDPAPDQMALDRVVFDRIRLEERTRGKEWTVRATLSNQSNQPLSGGDFKISLTRKGETSPFAVHSALIFFSPAVPAGRTTAFVSTVPVGNIQDLPPIDGVEPTVTMLSAKAPPTPPEDWKPLDPTTAPVKEVGEKILVTPDGQRITLPPASPSNTDAG